MNADMAMATALAEKIVAGSTSLANVDILLCPPYPYLFAVGKAMAGSACQLGAQDVDRHAQGAFTGQVSASMLLDSGCTHVIIGHSERRTLHHETNALVAEKAKTALDSGLIPVLCIGETRQEREEGIARKVVSSQIRAVVDRIGIEAFRQGIIAYEPVWAIGTGLTATPDQAQAIHQHIRRELSRLDEGIAADCRILYGGSMKPDNAEELVARPDIDGGLIGGASLHARDFLGICQAAESGG